LSPHLCSKILRSCNGPKVYCKEIDVTNLRTFLNSDHNFMSKETKSESVKRKALETQILKAVKNPSKDSLSSGSRQHLYGVLRSLYTPEKYRVFRQQPLLENHVIVALERLYEANSRSNVLKRFLAKRWRYCRSVVIGWLFKPQISALGLRRKAQGIEAKPGLEIAHKLSLFLAVQLWRHINGGKRSITALDLRNLKRALSSRPNVYHTCTHTNRTLHVQYDNEIANALKSSGIAVGNNAKKSTEVISDGARVRVRQILSALNELQNQSDTMNRFSKESVKMLRKFK